MATAKDSRFITALVWLSRLTVGAVFILSGWSKSIDPWGFIYKMEEYFNVWGWCLPREMTLAASVVLSVLEFTVGCLIFLGLMRKAAVWIATAFIAFMLPLTAYIFFCSPVADCGCFGDFIIMSNTATFVKNIVVAILLAILLRFNCHVNGIVGFGAQWFVALLAVLYSSVLAFIGYRYQPLLDFRTFPVGSSLFESSDDGGDESDDTLYIYEKDGFREEFDIEHLPDSSWVFVESHGGRSMTDTRLLSIYDEGTPLDVDSLMADTDLMVLAVANPEVHYVARARLANDLYANMTANSGKMFALIPYENDDLKNWKQLALPRYPVYSADDTSIKELVRGDAGLVFVRDGKIVGKRNLSSVSVDGIQVLPYFADALFPENDIWGETRFFWFLTALLVVVVLAVAVIFPSRGN